MSRRAPPIVVSDDVYARLEMALATLAPGVAPPRRRVAKRQRRRKPVKPAGRKRRSPARKAR